MTKEIIQSARTEFGKAFDFFAKELLKLRTGQANPAMVEDVPVESYGTTMPLKQLAGISCPERHQILIQPWDRGSLEAIAKALQKTNLGTSPIVDKDSVRITLPPLTNEFRVTIAKMLSEKAEQTRQVMRKERDLAWDKAQTLTKEGKIREDDKFRAKDELQKLIDEYNKKIEELSEKKKREIEL
ncbi:MAG: ribosome recycling factor [Candidatus Wildermuthbacteria bacterium]|nr:ribosome recycling factor [Candidatus Wildermuthbacteria bacterium]